MAGDRVLPEPAGISTLQAALDEWELVAPALRAEYKRFEAIPAAGLRIQADELHSPLPRAYQWCEGSTYLPHMERIRRARGMELPPEHLVEPIVYQAGADQLLAPNDPIELPDVAWGLDLEATLAVITDDVPVGTTVEAAVGHVAFVVLLNDLTYRNLIPREYEKRVGPYQSKPTRAFAPIAVAPEALGNLWADGLVRARVTSWVNDEILGAVASDVDNSFTFPEMIAFLTKTRSLAAGSIVGLGTVANYDLAMGFGCIAEKRAVESLADGEPHTPWLRPGDRVRIEALSPAGASIFGAVDQVVVDVGRASDVDWDRSLATTSSIEGGHG